MSWKPNRSINNKIKRVLEGELENSVEILAKKVKDNAPKDTGKLKKSIKVEKNDELDFTVIADVPYAQVVEFGKFGRAADPFFRSAVKESAVKMLQQFKNKL